MDCDSNDVEMSSDESDTQDDEKELENISYYKAKINENPLHYDSYIGLITAYRKIGELEELRKSRETMNKIYPLSPDLWMDWVSDEQKICTSKEERKYVIELFKRSVKEYMSVQIWVEYIMFMLGGGNMAETREVCEEALTAVGIHFAEGILVWQAVSLVEQQINPKNVLNFPLIILHGFIKKLHFQYLLSLQESDKEREEQQKRIQNLYRRQARVPLMNLNKEEFLTDCQKWFNDDKVDPQIKRDLDSSCEKMREKMPFEENLLRARDETEKIEAYRKYIDYARSNDNPASIQNIYERTVTDLCLNAVLLIFLCLCINMNISPKIFFIFSSHAEGTVEAVKKSLECGVSDEIEVIKIWMSYLVYLRREIHWKEESVKDELRDFRDACDQALTFIQEKFGEEGDKECRIARFQSRVEAESARDIEACRAVWNDYIMRRNQNYKVGHLWIEFLNLERMFGSEKHCRKLYRRALEKVWDDVEVADENYKKQSPRSDVSRGAKRNISELNEEDVPPPPGYKQSDDDRDKAKKLKVSNEHGEFVKHDSSLDHRSVFLSNLEYKTEREEILAVFQDCGEVDTLRIAKDFKGRSKGFGYLVFVDAASVPKALAKDRTIIGNRPVFVSKCDPDNRDHAFKFNNCLEENKLFVKGLSLSMNENEVRAAFEPHGKIKAIRLVTLRNGISKGICYIEYNDAETAEKVRQKMDQTVLENHTITVLVSDPPAAKNKSKNDNPTTTMFARPNREPKGQRPKLSLLPRALLRASKTSNTSNGESPSTSNGSGDANGSQNSGGKSNADFRKLFMK
ncbi:Squamous cell carcinoma antigen recognized by T-cells 3 [Armadillidium nasatum]|uniref:Squamous cell carcinoma antigen recognized by T-cells 3 n=1 Tax=Armadillidium nasatum TaxID=96803 RepID=A0A5N5T563_9CRUS|nr:Squamous cell carcinoma antigen recognized by T-cells 3 [Armadillidium nasatum]